MSNSQKVHPFHYIYNSRVRVHPRVSRALPLHASMTHARTHAPTHTHTSVPSLAAFSRVPAVIIISRRPSVLSLHGSRTRGPDALAICLYIRFRSKQTQRRRRCVSYVTADTQHLPPACHDALTADEGDGAPSSRDESGSQV